MNECLILLLLTLVLTLTSNLSAIQSVLISLSSPDLAVSVSAHCLLFLLLLSLLGDICPSFVRTCQKTVDSSCL